MRMNPVYHTAQNDGHTVHVHMLDRNCERLYSLNSFSGEEFVKNAHALLVTYQTELNDVLRRMRYQLFEILDGNADPEVLQESVNRWHQLREQINTEEHTGAILAIKDFKLILFPLTGNPRLDIGQGKQTSH